MRRLRTTVLVTAVLVSAPLATQVPAAAAPTASPDGAVVVTYDNGHQLANASVHTMAGSRAAGGGCTFRPPELKLAPGAAAIAARQIETNFSTCTTKIEIGTPRAEATPADGTSQREQAKSAETSGLADDRLLAATSSAGYYRVWWEDVINIKVHEVKSNVSWVWNGSCTSSSSGSADYWWRTGTGWSKNSSSVLIARSCYEARVYTDTTYRNGAFCWPGVVWSYYDNVTATGRYNGWLHGWVDGTSTSYPFACPTLHFHTELRRTLN
jgi:hypothetical protein